MIKQISEKYFIGCNYWASHAGTNMWSDFQPEIVEQDLYKLKHEAKLDVIRAFPLWSDFQPIEVLYTGNGHEREVGINGMPLDINNKAGINEVMMERFLYFLDLCEKYELKVIVSLITGWMSGRLFVPVALRGRNLVTDPFCVMWETKFVRYFVKKFKGHSSICAWEFGNECNCIAETASEYEAWCWSSAISDAVKAIDNTRPFISGMHSLTGYQNWNINNQMENTDLLTVHPYNIFTPYANYEHSRTIKALMHATCENNLYADLGERDCFVEEIGSLGPANIGAKSSAKWIRANLFSTWANNCHGFLWWCGFEQSELRHPPYQWNHMERELGLFYKNGDEKPVINELTKFKEFIDSLPFEKITKPQKQAVVIIPDNVDVWAVAYSSFIFAKQAGFEVEFKRTSQELVDSNLYIIPCIKDTESFNKNYWEMLKEKVKNGATLYVSYDGGFLSEFPEVFGLEVDSRYVVNKNYEVEINGVTGNIFKEYTLKAEVTTSEVLGLDNTGNILFTKNKYEKGSVYFLNLPLEFYYSNTPGAYENSYLPQVVYKEIGKDILSKLPISKSNINTAITLHKIDDKYIICVINYEPFEVIEEFKLNGYSIGNVYYGKIENNRAIIRENDALVFEITK